MVSRRRFLAQAGLAACGAWAAGNAGAQANGERPPNIVFILADDMGWGDLACYGHPHIQTPHIDRLAAEGLLFTQAYAASPVCSPTRASILTGRFPARDGIHAPVSTAAESRRRDMPNYLDPALPTMTRMLQEAGYAVGHFGKWHLGGGEAAPDTNAPPPTAYGIDESYVFSGNGPGWEKSPDFAPRSSEWIVDKTLDFIERRKDQPFLAQVWLRDPHNPIAPTDEQRAAYPGFGGLLQGYYAVISEMDRQIGRLMARLDELGLRENTLVIVTSDNGPEAAQLHMAQNSGGGSAGPFRGRKRSLYEGGIRVPLIVRWPGKTLAGVVDDASVVCTVDYLPTLCAIAGVPAPEGLAIDGEDRSHVLKGAPSLRTKPLYWEFRSEFKGEWVHQSPWAAIRDGQWKLLLNPDLSRIELYDVIADPGELDNRRMDEPEIAARLQAMALAMLDDLPKAYVYEKAGEGRYPWPGRN